MPQKFGFFLRMIVTNVVGAELWHRLDTELVWMVQIAMYHYVVIGQPLNLAAGGESNPGTMFAPATWVGNAIILCCICAWTISIYRRNLIMATRGSIKLWLFGLLAVVLIALVISAIRLATPRFQAMAETTQSGQIAPFTVIQKETITDASGILHPGTLTTKAVRADGSTVLRMGNAETGGRDITFSDGRKVVVFDHRKTRTTIMTKRMILSQQDPASLCMNKLDGSPATAMNQKILGQEVIAGYRAVKISYGGTTVIWHALDHGCADIKSEMHFGVKEASGMSLVMLIPGEPDQTLFVVPDDYKEGPPSFASPPEDVKAAPDHFKHLDKAYYDRRQY
jgi:hypothetical protein